MAKIKKLKENGTTIYPATIPEAVVDPNNKTKLSEIIDDLALTFGDPGESKNIIQAMSDLRSTIGEHSESGLDGYAQYLNLFIDKVNAFLEDADASDATINRWKEIESFLTGITDTETLTGLLAENLKSAKGYADTKVQQGTANAVTMSSNAGAADRVLTSAGTNKTAKDSGVSIGDLAKKDLSNVGTTAFKDKDILPVVVVEYSMTGDSIDNFNSFAAQVTGSAREAAHGECILFVHEQKYDVMSPVFSIADDSGAGLQDVLFISPKGRLYRISQDDDTGTYNSSYTLLMEGASTSKNGLMSKEDKTKLDGIAAGANKYTLPVATASALGGVKSGGAFVSIGSDGIITVNQATKATQDKNGADIAATYLKSAAVTDVTEYAEITI